MKKIYAPLLIIAMLLTACQKTPEKLVVQNKNDGELEAAIEATATPVPEITEDIQESEEAEQKSHITDKLTNEAGTVTININADITLPGEGNITVARLERMGSDYFTEQYASEIMQTFFGKSIDALTFYDTYVTTKADIEAGIISLQKRMTDEEAMLNCDYAVNNGITNIEVIKAHINELIEKRKLLWNEAPENPPIINAFDGSGCYGTGSSFNAYVDFGGEYRGKVSISDSTSRSSPSIGMSAFGGEHPFEGRCFDFNDTQIDIDSDDPGFLTAKQTAQNFADEIGIGGVRAGDAYLVPDRIYGSTTEPLTGMREKIQISDREFYVFNLERIVGERTIDFTFYRGASSGDEEYVRTLPYERIQVWVEEDKIVSFNWSGVHTVREILNENAAVNVDYSQALNTAANQIFIDYIDSVEREAAEFITADITSIEFEMVRIKEKDSDYYISIPAWKLYGKVSEKLTEESRKERMDSLKKMDESYEYSINLPDDFVYPEYNSLTWWYGPNIYTINALDGSIIDMEKGY